MGGQGFCIRVMCLQLVARALESEIASVMGIICVVDVPSRLVFFIGRAVNLAAFTAGELFRFNYRAPFHHERRARNWREWTRVYLEFSFSA